RRFLHFKGISRPVVSPTFIYYESYPSDDGDVVYYHFDLYRISSEDEFFMLGGEEIMQDENAICLIEWPESISGLFADDRTIRMYFEMEDDGKTRKVTVRVP
ncbi:MAG TPA: tRNA (adenosine(37)-N6)-threonylcarbamoyltransferase complex ATPase subunit type 1 TsaE, partial [Spirochaetaceae bacterium]|nr:tRNA (adenosine(37)-N6)-threonylcarbamoyltransferase complex ATPase subunit type 1 TsaE [Spirochaetaceae bacterium]